MIQTQRPLPMIALVLCVAALAAAQAIAQEDKDPTPAKVAQPVKVYILLGQSNMLGFGQVGPDDTRGTLGYVTKTEKKYAQLLDADGKWVVRDDVRYTHVMQSKPMKVLRNEWLTVGEKFIGPELMIGHQMGDYHDGPVLILKACIGNRSLGWDYLPPGSERFEYRGKTYAGYRDPAGSWTPSEPPTITWKDAGWYAGKQYDDDVRYAKTVLKNLGDYYPGATEYEISGFFWWQGHKDQNAVHASRYEQNLVQFIKALRKDFAAPDAPFVCATIAFGGRRIKGHGLTIVKAQLAVDGDKGKYPAFKDNVKSVDARPCWQPRRRSPGGGGHHYNHNALTYLDVGNGMGEAMVELLKRQSKDVDDKTD
jgi:hypothetical protein